MSAYARVRNNEVIEILDLDEQWIQSLKANGNPKQNEFFPVTVDAEPVYSKTTHYAYSTYSIQGNTVQQSWVVAVLETPDS